MIGKANTAIIPVTTIENKADFSFNYAFRPKQSRVDYF